MLQLRSPSYQVFGAHFAATLATVAKIPFVENGKVFIPMNTEDAGVEGAHVYQSEVSDAVKTAAEAWEVGDVIYWNDTTKAFTTTVGTNVLCGVALAPADAADTVSPLFLFKGI